MFHRIARMPQTFLGLGLMLIALAQVAIADAGGTCQTIQAEKVKLVDDVFEHVSWGGQSCGNGQMCPVGCIYRWTVDGYKYCSCAGNPSENCNLAVFVEPPAAFRWKCIVPTCTGAKICEDELYSAEGLDPVDHGDGTYTFYWSCFCVDP